MGLFNDINNGINNIFNINNYDMLSYASILNDIQKFKRSGTNNGSEFNYYDTKAHKFFKILFYFGEDVGKNDKNKTYFDSGGLLTPTWNKFKDIETFQGIDDNKVVYNVYDDEYNYYSNDLENLHIYNSAWAYLMLNDEKQRAKHLEHFVNLLSNISSESPWYLMAIEGIADALERKPATDGKFEFTDSKKLTIKCIEDAFDNRISTLLDLYRDITWSWNMKREILPANLRKFDMAIYIFESPILKWHEEWNNGLIDNKTINIDSKSGYQPSYKMLEFHNCEIDYNSIKSGWSELSNEGGIQPKYSIDIKYDDCYEISYNEFIMEKIGDIILSDFYSSSSLYPKDTIDKSVLIAGLNKRMNPYDKGFLGNALNQVIGAGVNYIEDKLERALLGNLHTYSLTQIGSQVKDLMDGNVIKTVQAAQDYIDESKKRKEQKSSPNNNISTSNKYGRPVEFDDNEDNNPIGNLAVSRTQIRPEEFEDNSDTRYGLDENGFRLKGTGGERANIKNIFNRPPTVDEVIDYKVKQLNYDDYGSKAEYDKQVKSITENTISTYKTMLKTKKLANMPTGDLFSNEASVKEKPSGDLFSNEASVKEKPSGDLFSNEASVKEKPSGNITAQQLAALKVKGKPTGKIFDNITLINNI